MSASHPALSGRAALVAGCVAALLAGSIAIGEEVACPHVPAIVSLSETVLDQRQVLPRLQARNFGAEAAYLVIRYGSLDELAVESLLQQVADGDIRHGEELVAAWYVSTLGFAAASEVLGDVTQVPGVSVARALLLHGGADALMRRVAGEPQLLQVGFFRQMVAAIVDQDEEIKSGLVKDAMKHGLTGLAGGFAAARQDATAWTTFIATVTDPKEAERLTWQWRWIPVALGRAELPWPGREVIADPALRQKLLTVQRAAALQPQQQFLLTFVNQTGLVDEALAASNALAGAILAGDIDKHGPLDAGWLLAYRQLLQSGLTAETIDEALSANAINSGRPGRSTVRDNLDWMIALEQLSPYLRGETVTIPPPPREVSEAFAADWPRWTELARKIAAGATPSPQSVPESDLPILAELLLARGQGALAANLLRSAPPSWTSVSTAAELALRLDRHCEAYLWHPAEAVLLPGEPIFKFESATGVANGKSP